VAHMEARPVAHMEAPETLEVLMVVLMAVRPVVRPVVLMAIRPVVHMEALEALTVVRQEAHTEALVDSTEGLVDNMEGCLP